MSTSTVKLSSTSEVNSVRNSSLSGGGTHHKEVTCELLARKDFPLWDNLVDASPHGTVFHYSWWLEITSPSFELLVVRDEDGRLVGGIPLPRQRSSGLRLIHSPHLTPYLGPIFDLSFADGTCDRLYLMRFHGEILARHIADFDSFRCIVGATAPDLQGFLWAGFRAQLVYTFRFFFRQTLEEITKGITRTHFQKLNKAKRLDVRVIRNDRMEHLLELNRMTFGRQGALPPFSESLVLQLWKAADSRGKADLYIARSAKDEPVAGLFTVHDSRATYQIVSGFNPTLMDIPGQNILLWSAVQDAINAGRDFDFEGSALRGVETFYRRWGASSVPIWRIEKASTLRGTVAQFFMYHRDSEKFRSLSR